MSSNDKVDKIVATINAYVNGFADCNLDGICDLYDSNATVEDPYGSPRKNGIEEIRDFYKQALSAKPRLKIIGSPIIVDNFSATHLRATIEFGDNTMEINLISVMSYNVEGKIISMTAHFAPDTINA